MDQRKVNMLAREYCDDIRRKTNPSSYPTVCFFVYSVPCHLVFLSVVNCFLQICFLVFEKMSKSNPSSAIFMEDEEVN